MNVQNLDGAIEEHKSSSEEDSIGEDVSLTDEDGNT